MRVVAPGAVVVAVEAVDCAEGAVRGPPQQIAPRVRAVIAAAVAVDIRLKAVHARIHRRLDSSLQRHTVASPPHWVPMLRRGLGRIGRVGVCAPVRQAKLGERHWFASIPLIARLVADSLVIVLYGRVVDVRTPRGVVQSLPVARGD